VAPTSLAEALRRALLPLAAAALAMAAAAASAARHLEGAFANLHGTAGRRPRRRTANSRRAWGGAMGALLVRDARLFVRDWTVMSDVFTGAALWTLLPLVGAPLHAAAPVTLTRAMILALTVGLGYEVGARAVPFERSGLALTRLTPLPAARWVMAKLVGGALVCLPLLGVAVLALALTFHLPAFRWLEVFSAAIAALAVSTSLGIWIGLEFGDPTWTNPRAMLTLTGRLTASTLLIGQAGLWLAVLESAERWRPELPAGLFLWGPPLAAALICVPLLAVARVRFERFEWRR
jgi:hypothetical protein